MTRWVRVALPEQDAGRAADPGGGFNHSMLKGN
jgi:hypothetical protein